MCFFHVILTRVLVSYYTTEDKISILKSIYINGFKTGDSEVILMSVSSHDEGRLTIASGGHFVTKSMCKFPMAVIRTIK